MDKKIREVRISKGIYVKVSVNDQGQSMVSYITLPATGYPGASKGSYMAAEITTKGLRPVVVGITLARARAMLKAWFPKYSEVTLELVKKEFSADF